ncbi:hypothetical protein GQ53DRAFT_826246 [Thozetella sp. PMI_491]|nr:hypothetical protein GQ53DRAFT_826246 [Thozetella sp. PMI_491]
MIVRNAYRLFGLVTAAFLYICFPGVYQFGDWVRQTNPFSGQKYIEQAFIASKAELACLHGKPFPGEPPPDDAARRDPIPNIVHFIFGLKNPLEYPDAGHFDFMSYLAVRSAVVSLEPDTIYLHYTYLSEPPSPDPNADPLTNPWIKRLAKHVTLVHHPPDRSKVQYAHLSDIMRLEFLRDYGGIYLDIDAFALRPFDGLRSAPQPHDIVLGAEGGNRWGLCNAIIAARPNSTFVDRWLESYQNIDFSKEWNYHSVLLPRELAQAYPSEACTLAPDAFFWPTWTWRHVDWMHTPLTALESKFWRAEIRRHGGSLFQNQVAYHAWNQMSWDRYLKKLTPETVRSQETRFNLLMRRFMEDDL